LDRSQGHLAQEHRRLQERRRLRMLERRKLELHSRLGVARASGRAGRARIQAGPAGVGCVGRRSVVEGEGSFRRVGGLGHSLDRVAGMGFEWEDKGSDHLEVVVRRRLSHNSYWILLHTGAAQEGHLGRSHRVRKGLT